MLLITSVAAYAQKDVTQFLGIPVDGYKAELIKKLKSKGFTSNQYNEDILDGEFNGKNVNIFFGTNNNKVWRIAVSDVDLTNETNIKIRFNYLIQQFKDNNRYLNETDSTLTKYTISNEEDISHEITFNKKRYEAIFYQKSLKYDSLIEEYANLIAKDTLNAEEKKKLNDINSVAEEEVVKSLNKLVWFMIKEDYGKYRIVIFYENSYNKANGDDL